MGQGQVPSTLYVCNNREFLTEKFKLGIPEKKQGGKRQVKPSLSLGLCQGILRLELFGYLNWEVKKRWLLSDAECSFDSSLICFGVQN